MRLKALMLMLVRLAFSVSIVVATCGVVDPGTVPALPTNTAKMLFCAHGGISPVPPAESESEFAEVVVEINNAEAVPNVSVTRFTISDASGLIMELKRVVGIQRFNDQPPASGLGYAAYYLQPNLADSTYAWSGTLPRGTILLRVRMALVARGQEGFPAECRLVVGPYDIRGPLDAVWPTT